MNKALLTVIFLTAFNSLLQAADLIDVYQQALQQDPRVGIAEFNVAIGEERESQVVADLLPQLNITSSISTNRQDFEGDVIGSSRNSFKGERHSAVLSQSLFDLPRFYNWERQQKITAQAQHDQLDTQKKIILDVIESYFNVLLAQDDLTVAEDEKKTTKGILDQIERLYDKKMVKVTDLMNARVRYDMAVVSYFEAKTELVAAREKITELTGRDVGALSALKKGIEFKKIVRENEEWLELLSANNPSLLAKRDAISAEGSGVKQHLSGHLPVIDFQLMVQRTDLGFNNSSARLTNTTSASVNVNMPLFTGGKASALHAEAVHRLESSKLDYEAVFRKLRRELVGVLTKVNLSVEKIRAGKIAVVSAEKNFMAMKKGFKYGVVDSTDLFEAQHFLSKANRDLYYSKYDFIGNKSKLLYLSGLINRQEIELINQWLEPR